MEFEVFLMVRTLVRIAARTAWQVCFYSSKEAVVRPACVTPEPRDKAESGPDSHGRCTSVPCTIVPELKGPRQ